MTSKIPQTTWHCYGDRSEGKEGHPQQLNTGAKCTYPGCGLPCSDHLYPRTKSGEEFEDKEFREQENNPTNNTGNADNVSKDKVLLATLSILNFGSGYTTIVGASQIFPGMVGYASGGIIQLVLFLLLSGSAASHAPIRKWLTVIVFSFISVYTSFFAYYDKLTEKEQKQESYQRALIASQQVRSDLLAPLENQVRQLEGEISQLKILLQGEIDGNRGIAGNGPIAQKIRTQIEQKELNLAKLKPNVIEFQKKFPSPKPGESPEAIFHANIQALQSVPNQYRSPKYQGDLNKLRSEFFDIDTTIPLLTPYRKVMKGGDSAIAAMTLAIGVDGLIIIMGTAIDKRKKIDRKKIELPLPLQKSASEFLSELNENIDLGTGLIKHKTLIENNPNGEGFRILLDTMRGSDLGWIEIHRDADGEKWYISPNVRDEFRTWYVEERQYQSENEAKKSKNSQLSQSVKFVLPSRKSSRQEQMNT